MSSDRLVTLARTACRCCVAAALAVGAVPVALPATPGPQQQAAVEALTRAHAAVVGVEVSATAGARSAETLGRQRSGSGVVIGPDGLVLTIGYLMLEAENIQLVTQDKRSVPARAVAYDLATGFGLVRPLLPLRGIAPVPLGSVADLKAGDAVMAATGGEDGDVDLVQVIDKRPFSGYWEYHIETALFTSPPIDNHSGAAVFNQRGELLGVGSLLVADATGQGRPLPGNMFVPIDLLKPILAELQQSGISRQSRRPWIGLTSSEQGGRVQVVRVNRDSPAEAGGMRPGDVVLAVDGARVATLEEFYKKLWDRTAPDAEVSLTVLQGADIRTLTLKPVDRMNTMARPAGI
ncbi:S1C family serine protease [Ramlibacter sp. Leaf400]|uniref:S1C family serine protease n=1 Tax=Ramlibacter sp. Leaf400 TaxID=1736365 RepID=UPI0006FE1BB9|nr:S1C family serine protease [Ramlibacter sp. Leaf400]KQT14375.1 signal protein PDZ [Ramlibacter sp. Leaf400]